MIWSSRKPIQKGKDKVVTSNGSRHMLCELKTFQHRETCSESNEIRKSTHACIIESTWKRLGRSPSMIFNSLSHYNLLHKFVPMPQAMKVLGSKSSSGQDGKSSKNLRAWQDVQSKVLKIVVLEPKFQKHEGQVVVRGDILQRQLRPLHCFY